MKKISNLFLWLLPAVLLIGGGISKIHKTPFQVFLLKGAEGSVDAYQLTVFLDRQGTVVKTFPLSADQKKEGLEILRQKDRKRLADYSNAFGKYGIVIGFPTVEEGWPALLGGGWRAFLSADSADSFDNLQWMDRFYLALRSTAPPTTLFSGGETPQTDLTKAETILAKMNPIISSTPVQPIREGSLRVEIQNGCGIKGAADWAARRLKGQGILITTTGNADHFHYTQTLVTTSAGIPISLEEAVERLGLTKESIKESPNPEASVDVVVIVGRDYRKIKELVRERNQH